MLVVVLLWVTEVEVLIVLVVPQLANATLSSVNRTTSTSLFDSCTYKVHDVHGFKNYVAKETCRRDMTDTHYHAFDIV